MAEANIHQTIELPIEKVMLDTILMFLECPVEDCVVIKLKDYTMVFQRRR